jgi:hypothetical protein
MLNKSMASEPKFSLAWFYSDNELNILANHVKYGIQIDHAAVCCEMLFVESAITNIVTLQNSDLLLDKFNVNQ